MSPAPQLQHKEAVIDASPTPLMVAIKVDGEQEHVVNLKRILDDAVKAYFQANDLDINMEEAK